MCLLWHGVGNLSHPPPRQLLLGVMASTPVPLLSPSTQAEGGIYQLYNSFLRIAPLGSMCLFHVLWGNPSHLSIKSWGNPPLVWHYFLLCYHVLPLPAGLALFLLSLCLLWCMCCFLFFMPCREDWKPVLTINSIIYGLQYLFLVST